MRKFSFRAPTLVRRLTTGPKHRSEASPSQISNSYTARPLLLPPSVVTLATGCLFLDLSSIAEFCLGSVRYNAFDIMTETTTPLEEILVKTTLPVLPYYATSRPVIQTARLLLRPLAEDDLTVLHEMRTQHAMMQWTPTGKTDADLDRTRKFLHARLEGGIQKEFEHGICLAETGELIGYGGIFAAKSYHLGWPEVGYSFRQEYWGKGYGTEFLRALLDRWWRLPRRSLELRVDKTTVPECAAAGESATERLLGITVADNLASRAVLAKSGMSLIKLWEVEDLRDETKMIVLYGYAVKRPEDKTASRQ